MRTKKNLVPASTFIALTDTPVSYTGAGNKYVRVNGAASALEFADAGGGTIDSIELRTLVRQVQNKYKYPEISKAFTDVHEIQIYSNFTNLYHMCWSPKLRLFCAVSDSATNRTAISSDGIIYTPVDSAGDSYSWSSVIWSPELSLFCSGGFSGDATTKMRVSYDGINWTFQTLPVDPMYIGEVVWSSHLGIFCALATLAGGTIVSLVSSDGFTWNYYTISDPLVSGFWVAMCWADDLKMFCAVSYLANDSYAHVLTSPDGINWTPRDYTYNAWWRKVVRAPELGIFCALAYSNSSSPQHRILISKDGINWNIYATNYTGNWSSLCWIPEWGVFIAGSASNGGLTHGDSTLTYSYDGITWYSIAKTMFTFVSLCWAPELSLVSLASSDGRISTTTLVQAPLT